LHRNRIAVSSTAAGIAKRRTRQQSVKDFDGKTIET
jgi:hypothetical protein